jgi:hypothetical protein
MEELASPDMELIVPPLTENENAVEKTGFEWTLRVKTKR